VSKRPPPLHIATAGADERIAAALERLAGNGGDFGRIATALEQLVDIGDTLVASQRPPLPPDKAQALNEFLRAVHAALGSEAWRAGALLNQMTKETAFAWQRVYDATTDLLDAKGVEDDTAAAVALGRKLQRVVGRTDPETGLRIERAGTERAATLWRVVGAQG
jgi:hypothetical protein